MARSKKAPGVGHNAPPLNDEEAEALGVHHQLTITAAQRKLDAAQAEVSGLRKNVNAAFKRMTADLGITRQAFQAEVIDKLNMTPGEYAAHMALVDRLHRIAGLKTGEQLDLLQHVADTVDEQELAFQDGYRAGRRADDPVPPKHITGIMQPKWMEGWHGGQAFNAMRLDKAGSILAERAAKPAEGELAPEAGEEADELEAMDEEVRRLERSGWAKPTDDEAEAFETENNGRTVRRAAETV